jgi:hypothetical protein
MIVVADEFNRSAEQPALAVAGNGNDRPRSGTSLSQMQWYEREAKRHTPSALSKRSS